MLNLQPATHSIHRVINEVLPTSQKQARWMENVNLQENVYNSVAKIANVATIFRCICTF